MRLRTLEGCAPGVLVPPGCVWMLAPPDARVGRSGGGGLPRWAHGTRQVRIGIGLDAQVTRGKSRLKARRYAKPSTLLDHCEQKCVC